MTSAAAAAASLAPEPPCAAFFLPFSFFLPLLLALLLAPGASAMTWSPSSSCAFSAMRALCSVLRWFFLVRLTSFTFTCSLCFCGGSSSRSRHSKQNYGQQQRAQHDDVSGHGAPHCARLLAPATQPCSLALDSGQYTTISMPACPTAAADGVARDALM